MGEQSSDIQVDTSALRTFSSVVQGQQDGHFREDVTRAMPLLDRGAGAVGRDGRFTEAAQVDVVGAGTTASAKEFAQGLADHIATLTTDVRDAADQYHAVDQAAADADVSVSHEITGVMPKLESVENDLVAGIGAMRGTPRNS